ELEQRQDEDPGADHPEPRVTWTPCSENEDRGSDAGQEGSADRLGPLEGALRAAQPLRDLKDDGEADVDRERAGGPAELLAVSAFAPREDPLETGRRRRPGSTARAQNEGAEGECPH